VRERYEAGDDFACDFSVPPQFCEDACCRAHDECCSSDDTSSCNRQMLACDAACAAGHAWQGDAPVCAAAALAIAAADGEGLCCGSPCPDKEWGGEAPTSRTGGVTLLTDYAEQQVHGYATVHIPLGWIPFLARAEPAAASAGAGAAPPATAMAVAVATAAAALLVAGRRIAAAGGRSLAGRSLAGRRAHLRIVQV